MMYISLNRLCSFVGLILFALCTRQHVYCNDKGNHVVMWNKGHSFCRFMPHVGTNASDHHFDGKLKVHCTLFPYYEYVQKHLPLAEGYRKDVLTAIHSMYTTLDSQRQPWKYDGTDVMVHPITFAIPSELVQRQVPPKYKAFSTVIPGKRDTYIFSYMGSDVNVSRRMERDYFEDMKRSYFALTMKKLGWDCLRHLEIMASGTLPIFTNIEDCPPRTLGNYPKELLKAILRNPALEVSGKAAGDDFMLNFKEDAFDSELYYITTLALLQYTKNVLTTEAMAGYMLSTVGINPRMVLYLTANETAQTGDYIVDTMLHGLKSIIGDHNVVDYPRRKPLYAGLKHLTEDEFYKTKNGFYGRGFTFSMRTNEVPGIGPSRESIPDLIRRQAFDLVIFASGHYNTMPDFFDEVCQMYPPSRVAVLYGGDYGLPSSCVQNYRHCVSNIFAREIY